MEKEKTNFYGLGIAPRIIDILDKSNIRVPTPIQEKAIPVGLAGQDVIGIAQTGTGKTLAFAIPMLQRLAQIKGKGLILVPTRELAIQVAEVYFKLGHTFGIKLAVLIGGAPMYRQLSALQARPRVIVATPGRLIDHLQQRTVSLNDVSVLVLDEADRMLDMGFAPQIETILRSVPRERQTMLFSASIPNEIVRIASAHMKIPVSVEIAPSGTVSENVTQEIFIVKKEMKNKLLQKVLDQYKGSVLLFTRTKRGASRLTRTLRDMRYAASEIHSDKTLSQRREALEGFKAGKYRILVATDIAARGIDVHGIELVINFDLPDDSENYTHRIGRTGRASYKGHAISFAMPDQKNEVRSIEKLIRIAVPISVVQDISEKEFYADRLATRSHGGWIERKTPLQSWRSRGRARKSYRIR
ncbi:MAG TPA: DEAD/DEAH box helicase [bacterium]|nr:DEAD/DEAH box helicase [bacterium]